MFLPFGERTVLKRRRLVWSFVFFMYSSFLWRDVSRESPIRPDAMPFRGRWPQASASVWLVYLFSLRSNILEPSNFDNSHTTDANGKYFSRRRFTQRQISQHIAMQRLFFCPFIPVRYIYRLIFAIVLLSFVREFWQFIYLMFNKCILRYFDY